MKLPRFTVRDRDRVLLHIDFGELPTKYPYTLMVPQNEIEEVLEGRLARVGGKVSREVEVIDVVQHGSCVQVSARLPDGGLLVREKAKTGFRGGTYAQSFILADVIIDWDSTRMK